MASSAQHQLGYRTLHSTEVVGENLFLWGGDQDGLPRVHNNEEKTFITSKVDIFNLPSLEWVRTATSGTPPAGAMDYGTTYVGNEIYFFGGRCDWGGCCHNELNVLNTDTKVWRRIPCSDGPMEKDTCGFISYVHQESDYLLALGGKRMKQPQQQHPLYVHHSDYYYTNEIHTMDMKTSPGEWRVPDTKGQTPPPLAAFTLDVLPNDRSKAVLFGGRIGTKRDHHHSSNDLYLLSLSSDTVEFARMSPQLHSVSQWPKPRSRHSSTILTSVGKEEGEECHLLVVGGDGTGGVIGDGWIMNITSKKWSKINLPENVCERYGHSISSVKMKTNTQWLIVTGGLNTTGVDVTVVIEMVYSENQWSVTNVWNGEQLISNKAGVQRRLLQHIIDERLHKCTTSVTDLITNIRDKPGSAATKKTSEPDVGKSEELLKEKQKEIDVLRSGAGICVQSVQIKSCSSNYCI